MTLQLIDSSGAFRRTVYSIRLRLERYLAQVTTLFGDQDRHLFVGLPLQWAAVDDGDSAQACNDVTDRRAVRHWIRRVGRHEFSEQHATSEDEREATDDD